ncbi:unnamed protein product, partial [Symbiodinium microadriaticum]
QQSKGILKALLVTSDGTVVSPNPDIDQLGVLANLQALTGLSTDIMAILDDECIHIMLDSGENSRLLLWRIQET